MARYQIIEIKSTKEDLDGELKTLNIIINYFLEYVTKIYKSYF